MKIFCRNEQRQKGPPSRVLRPPAITHVFLKRYLKINSTGDGIKCVSDADYVVKIKTHL
jgi:hypothetical protein